MVFVSGEGARLTDAAGRTFLDLAAGIAVNALGHSDRRWVDAVTAQAATLCHVSNLYHTEPQVRKWEGEREGRMGPSARPSPSSPRPSTQAPLSSHSPLFLSLSLPLFLVKNAQFDHLFQGGQGQPRHAHRPHHSLGFQVRQGRQGAGDDLVQVAELDVVALDKVEAGQAEAGEGGGHGGGRRGRGKVKGVGAVPADFRGDDDLVAGEAGQGAAQDLGGRGEREKGGEASSEKRERESKTYVHASLSLPLPRAPSPTWYPRKRGTCQTG